VTSCTRWKVLLLTTVFGAGFLFCLTGDLLLALRDLLTGWYLVPGRNVSKMKIDPAAVITGVAVCFMLTLVLHFLAVRLSSKRSKSPATTKRWRLRQSLAVVGLLAVSFVAGLSAIGFEKESERVVAKGFPTLGRIRDAQGARSHSLSNFNNFWNAIVNHNSRLDSLPAPTTYDERGRAMHGWHYALLPYLESQNLFNAIDPNKPWNHPDNDKPYRQEIAWFRHPVVPSTRDADGYPITTYAVNVHVLGENKPRRLSDFPNGGANVLLVGEVEGNFKAWGYPLNVRDPKLGLKRSPDGFGGPFRAGTQFLMADGSVRTFRDDTDPEFLQLLGEP
jgi:hypothetical protein